MPRSALNVDSYHVPVEGFSHAVLAPTGGRLLFVSGLTSRGPDGTVRHKNDIEGQTRAIFESLGTILAEAGGTLDDVVRIVTYLRDMKHHPRVHAIRREFLGDSPPASTSVEISRLYDEDQLIELEATAVVGGAV